MAAKPALALASHTTVLRAIGVLMARSASPPCLEEQVVSLTSPSRVVLVGFHEVLVDGQDRFWQQCRFVAGYSRTGRRE